MPRKFLQSALPPVLNLLDRASAAPHLKPSAFEETTRFPDFPWDLRTVIIVFPKDCPLTLLNLNILMGLTGVPFDQFMEDWGSELHIILYIFA